MYLRPQHIVPPSIRTILLLTIGALTLLIVSLAVYEIATQVQYLIKIRALRQAIMVNDHLFGATEKLSQERDMAYSLFYVGDKDSMAGLSSRLDVVRAQTDKALLDSLDAVKQYHFLDQDVPLQQMKAQFSALQELRAAIDKALALPPRKRDNALAERWFAETTVLILQTQNIWMDLISHFSRVDPQVSLHMRFKYMLGIIVDYSGREHSVIARLIAENTKPSDQELAQLVEWRGALGLAWKITDMLANHGGLEPGITTYLTEAQRHSFILYDTTKGTFYIPELFYGDPISINVLLKHAAQASGSLYALKDVALRETGTYMAALEMRMWRRITVDALFLVFAFLLSFYSFRIVNDRVIRPIHAVIATLVRAVEGESVAVPLPANPHDEIGKLVRVLQAFQKNAEELRDSVARLKLLGAIVESSEDAILSKTLAGIITSWNGGAEKLYGYSAAEAIGKSIDMIVPQERLQEENTIMQLLLEGKTFEHFETIRLNKSGKRVQISLSASLIRDASGKVIGVSKVAHDITYLKQAEALLLSYMRDLERSNKELDDFAYIASHDLKEPLRGIHNHACFLLEDNEKKLDPDSVSRLNRLTYLSQRMEKLVNDLLYFSRLGRQDMAIQETDMHAVIRDIESTLDVFLADHHARILVPAALPVIACDRTRVTELFRNLITNAVKYNDKVEKRVEIGFLESSMHPDGTRISNVFYVKDNGKGISQEFHEEVFRIFKRLQNGKDSQTEGTGVGLTFVKKIVERHGGRIWLASKTGKGTTFYFTLGGT